MRLLQSFSNGVIELADSVSPSVVNVNAGRRRGTGLVWSADGMIVTASHVVGHSSAPIVTTNDGKSMKAKVVGSDPYTDVALLRVEASGLTPMRLGNVDGIKVGQFVLALADGVDGRVSATSGTITNYRRSMRGFWGARIEDAVVSDTKLNPGYSGGPLVDASRSLLGMNVAYFAGRGVAIPVNSLKETVERISRDGRVKRGFLGVVIEPIELPEEIANSSEVGQDEGLLVRAVEVGSPARAAGVVIGDIILKLGRVRATNEFELHKALTGDVVGKDAKLQVLRAEKISELRITPAEAEE